jgi:hypothetical protein
MQHRQVSTFSRGAAEEDEQRIVAALLAGGDTRLKLNRQGVNKYLCPPTPAPSLVCLSSCTASPICDLGFERASAAFRRIATAPKVLEFRRIQECKAAIEAVISDYLGLVQWEHVILTASGTDGMLLAACLLALEGSGRPMTAILPSPSETGTGVPLAAACRAFDGAEAGQSLVDVFVHTEHVALRGPDGVPRETAAVAEDFHDAIRSARGRPRRHLYVWHQDRAAGSGRGAC